MDAQFLSPASSRFDKNKKGMDVPDDSFARSMSLIASQLEAASTLLKYAADDLLELSDRADALVPDDLRVIVQNLQAQASGLDGSAAFCLRLGEEGEDDGQAEFMHWGN